LGSAGGRQRTRQTDVGAAVEQPRERRSASVLARALRGASQMEKCALLWAHTESHQMLHNVDTWLRAVSSHPVLACIFQQGDNSKKCRKTIKSGC
jgi:hypothetical protein